MKSAVLALFAVVLTVVTTAEALRAQGGPSVAGSGPRRQVTLTAPLAGSLRQLARAEKGPVWFAWEVPATSSLRNACCFDSHFRGMVCRLDARDSGWGSNDEGAPGDGRLRVLVRSSGGRLDDVRGVSGTCGLDAGALPFVHLSGVDAAQSAALLAELAAGERAGDDEDGAMAALAYHGGAAADAAMRALATSGPRDRREDALFWIGQGRGAEGARFLATVARGDGDDELRKKAIFSLSQSDATAEAAAVIVDLARRDRSAEVRGEALFWLAQTDAPQAASVVFARVSEDPSPEVRKRAIFALTQLPKDGGVPLLIRVVREHRQPELRREAIFWLGQSEDPRALDFFEQVLGEGGEG